MELTEIKATLEKELGALKGLIAERDAQLKAQGVANEDTAKKLDAAGATVAELKAELAVQKKRADDVELKLNSPGFRVPGGERRVKSIGELFVEHANFKNMVAAGEMKCAPVEIKDTTGLLTGADNSAGAFVVPFRDPRLARLPDLAMSLRSLLTVVPVGMTNAIEFVRETGFYNLFTTLTETEDQGDTVLHVESTVGFFAGQTITIGGDQYTVDSIDADALTITITGDGLSDECTSGDSVTGVTFVGTAEGKVKPKMALSYELVTKALITLAHWIPASRQILSDAGQLRSAIDGRLVYGLGLSEEWESLNGSGTGQSLEGILNASNIQTYLWSSGVEGDTRIDAIRRAITLALKLNLGCDGILLNNTDWEHIQLGKGTDGHYLWLNVASGTEKQMFQIPVVPCEQIAAGTALVGAFKFGATLYDRQATTIRVAEQHEDYFARNQVAILAERRVAQAVNVPQAFVKVTFDSAPAEY